LAAGRKMMRRAGVAWRKENFVRRHSTKNNVEQETRKGRTEENRRRKGPECNNGIRDRGLRQQLRGSKRLKDPYIRRNLRLKIERTTDGIDRKTIGLEIVKRSVGISSRTRRMIDWT
jgi:hypothetical protein